MTLPRWKSHKEVLADKVIGTTSNNDPSLVITDDSGQRWRLASGALYAVTNALLGRVLKGESPVGGYVVRYADGFESWSPGKAFEEGYTRV